MKIEKNTIVALAIYNKAEWLQLKATAEDSRELDTTHRQWRRNMDKLKKKLQRDGIRFVEISVKMKALNDYCQKNNLPNISSIRAEYVSKLSQELDESLNQTNS